MRLINLLLLICLMLFLISCNEQKKYNYHETSYNDKAILKENKVHKIIETKIQYDTIGNPIWKRTESIKSINENGSCVLEIRPRYEGVSIDYLTRGYIYKRFSDTIDYNYNTNNQLIVIREIFHENDGYAYGKTTEYAYDLNGNKISECSSPDEAPINCWYYKFTYGKDNQIISRRDSVDYNISYDFTKPFKYKYDFYGNLLNDGNYEYKLDKKGNPVEFIPQFGLYSGFKRKYSEDNKIIEEMGYYHFNDIQKKLEYFQDPIIQYKYNTKSLVVEKKILYKNKIDYLIKYEYE